MTHQQFSNRNHNIVELQCCWSLGRSAMSRQKIANDSTAKFHQKSTNFHVGRASRGRQPTDEQTTDDSTTKFHQKSTNFHAGRASRGRQPTDEQATDDSTPKFHQKYKNSTTVGRSAALSGWPPCAAFVHF